MFTSRVLVTLGGVVGLSMATFAEPQPSQPGTTEPAKDQPTPAAPAVPATDTKDTKAAQPSGKITKEATDLIEKAKTAGKAIKDFTANVETTMKGDGSEGTTLKGKVIAVFTNANFPLSAWRIEPALAGTVKPNESGKVFAYDGTTVRGIDPTAKEMTETAAQPGMGFPMGEEGNLLPMWFMEQRQSQDRFAMLHPKVTEQVIEDAAAKVGSEKVTLVRQVRTMTLPTNEENTKPQTITETVRYWIGSDNLPRRTDQLLEIGGDEPRKQQITYTFNDLKVNTSPAADTFALKAPEGYKTKKIDPNETPAMTVKEGDAALDFALKDADGKEYKLSDFKGKVVVMDFWATWCGPCKQVMPAIQKVHETFKDKAVAVIGVNTWEKGEKAGPEYMAKKNFTYLCLLKGDDLAKAYGISGIPTIIVIDKEGKIAKINVGADPNEEEELTKLINEKLK